MSYHLNVRGLAGLHLGQHVTVKTKNTEASGILQGFNCGATAINDSSITGDSWILGATTCGITLLPDQHIVADMMDEVVVHGATAPEPEAPQFQSTALKILNDNPDVFLHREEDRGWKVGDVAHHVGVVDGKHIYFGGAAHQAEMNGETNGPGD